MSKLAHYRVPLEKGDTTATIKDPKTGQTMMSDVIQVTLTVPNTDIILEEAKNEKGEVIKDKESGEAEMVQREIRFVHGAKTIYVDEQVKAGFPKDMKKRPLDYITFLKGNYYVDTVKERVKNHFLQVTNYNLANPKRDTDRGGWFTFVDKQKESEKELASDMMRFQAEKLILLDLKGDSDMLRRLGRILLGSVDSYENDEIIGQLIKKTKVEASAVSGRISGAEQILAAYKTLGADTDDLVADAQKYGIIKIMPTKTIWASDETTITTNSVKGGEKAVPKLVQFLSNPENLDTLNTLRQLVKQEREKVADEQVLSTQAV